MDAALIVAGLAFVAVAGAGIALSGGQGPSKRAQKRMKAVANAKTVLQLEQDLLADLSLPQAAPARETALH